MKDDYGNTKMVKDYIRKPVQAKAVQWDGTNFDEVQAFCQDAFVEDGHLKVINKPGRGNVESYVVKSQGGEFFICSKEEFEDLYVEDDGRNYICTGSFY